MKFSFLKRGGHWLPTITVLLVVLLAGGRLISLSVEERAEQKRAAAESLVVRYGSEVEAALRELAERPRNPGEVLELDPLLSSVPLSRIISGDYDFELAKVDATAPRARIFVSTLADPVTDAVVTPVQVPAGFSQELESGLLQLAIRPKSGWYPVREVAAAIGLLALVAWMLGFATHDLVHSLHRARDAVAIARKQFQSVNRQLAMEIGEREALQKSFEHARYHDAFTGLPNRRYFMDQLDRGLRELRSRRRESLTVMLIEVDRFRLINDSLGHTAGDELIVQAARRFQRATATLECVLARWSTDQFALLILDTVSGQSSADHASLLHSALQEPLDLRKHQLAASVRIGVTGVVSGLKRTEEVLREADIALSHAKRTEGASTVAYQPGMGGSAASLVSLEADLHLAIERRELHLVFQPIVDLRTHRAAGMEALLRWNHPIEGILTPDRFLGLAEEAGLIVPITRWTIARACRVASEWRPGLPDGRSFYVSVNIAAAALRDPDLSSFVAQVLKDTRTPPDELKLELTEGGLISNPGAAREVLDGLHDLGIEMMLDDFGTGYSSLSFLQLFPFDYVKIDRPFVDPGGTGRANSAIASAIVQMAASLGLKSVAEIVETREAADDLERMGCDYAQGYFYCEPVEAEEALRLLANAETSLPAGRATAMAATRKVDEDNSPTVMLPAELVAAGLRERSRAG